MKTHTRSKRKKQVTVKQQLEQSNAPTVAPSVPAEDTPKRDMVQHAKTVLAPYHFQPGQSGNPSGRPIDVVKQIGKRIAHAKAGKVLKPKEMETAKELGFNTDDITLLEQIMLSLATSKNPQKIEMFLERTFGRVPNVNINAQINATLVARFKNKFTDAELEAIGDGANPMDILFDKLPDVEDNPAIPYDSDYVIDGDTTDDADEQYIISDEK